MELAQAGSYISLQNAAVDMYRGTMRLVMEKTGKIEPADGESFKPAVSARPHARMGRTLHGMELHGQIRHACLRASLLSSIYLKLKRFSYRSETTCP